MTSQSNSLDRRRVNGPESVPAVFPKHRPLEIAQNIARRQGRQDTEIRPLFLKTGLISQANGSVYIESQRTKVVCAAYGPRQTGKVAAYNELGKLAVDVKFAPFSSVRRKVPNKDSEDRTLATLIEQSITPAIRLELFPKSSIDIFILVLESDGVEACAAVGSMAASISLADAGIEMLGMVTACAASTLGQHIWLDPSLEECEISESTMLLSCIPSLGTITNVWQSGNIAAEKATEATERILSRCADIHHVVSQTLRETTT